MSDDLFDDEIATSVEPTAELRTAIRAIRRDNFDRLDWEMLLGNTPALRQEVAALEMDFPTSPPAFEDLFNLLFRHLPRWEDERQMVDEYRGQYALLKSTQSSADFDFLRKFSTHDEYYTTRALLELAGPLREGLEALRKAEEENAPFCPWPPEAGAGEAGGEADDYQPTVPVGAAAQVSRTMHEVAEDLEEEAALVEAYGVEDGELRAMSFEERRALVKQLSAPRLKRLADMLGAFRPSANAERRRRVVHAPGEVVNYTTGNDLTALAPEEFAALCIPELEEQFWVRWAQHGLRIEETRGTERVDRGPIIVVCDESESMTAAVDHAGNTREAWSKAVSLALCDGAKRDGRDFIYIGFSSKQQVWQSTFPNGQGPLSQVIEFAGHFYAGGTHFERPLRQALDVITTYDKAGKPKPDVVFITDGQCRVPPEFVTEWRQVRDAADVRCFGVQIGGSGQGMGQLVDRTIQLSRLNADPAGMAEIFRAI